MRYGFGGVVLWRCASKKGGWPGLWAVYGRNGPLKGPPVGEKSDLTRATCDQIRSRKKWLTRPTHSDDAAFRIIQNRLFVMDKCGSEVGSGNPAFGPYMVKMGVVWGNGLI